MAHLSEEMLEQYALGRLTRYRAELVREHVHLCRDCRERLQKEIDFAQAMKAAGEKFTPRKKQQ